MASNNGKSSEQHFVKVMESKPKTIVFRMRDAADLFGLNKRKVAIFGLPSDFIVVTQGDMFFAEVKSTQNKTSFSLDCLTPSQRAACLQVISCGGQYHIFVHRLDGDRWYRIPGSDYVAFKKASIKSIKWADLEELCISM